MTTLLAPISRFSHFTAARREVPRSATPLRTLLEALKYLAQKIKQYASMLNPRFRYPSAREHEWWEKLVQELKGKSDNVKSAENAVTAGLLAPSKLTGSIPSPSYFDKTFEKPEFIWNDGIANLDRVNNDILQQPARLQTLLDQPPPVLNNTESPAPLGDAVEAKKADLKAAVEVIGKPIEVRSAVMPLVSDVWNAVEPLNYVIVEASIK